MTDTTQAEDFQKINDRFFLRTPEALDAAVARIAFESRRPAPKDKKPTDKKPDEDYPRDEGAD